MEFRAAEEMAEGLLALYGLAQRSLFGGGGWTFGWNRRKRALGLCRYGIRRIELSTHFVTANEYELVRETILHEIAHALAGERAGHGPQWKAICLQIGCKPERCDKGEAVMPGGKWRAKCAMCAKEYHRHQRPARGARYWCKGCGPERGEVKFFLTMH